MKKTLFYIDPMSYNNLAIYDYSLLNNSPDNKDLEIFFFGNAKYNFKEFNNINFIPIFNYSDRRYIGKIVSYIFSYIKIFLCVIKKKPVIIHCQWFKLPWFDLHVIKLIKRVFLNIKIIYTAHNVLPHDKSEKYRLIYSKLYNKVDFIITHTESSKEEIVSLCNKNKENIHVIPHGLINYKIENEIIADEIKKLKRKHKIINQKIFISLGIQSYYKGIDLILNSWIKSKDLNNNDNLLLIIAGKGDLEYYKYIKSSTNIIIRNEFISDKEFIAYFKIADVVLLPYRKISQSGVLLTAINEEVPVLVSNVGGLTEPFRCGRIGWIMSETSQDELANLLTKISKNPQEINSIKNDKISWNKVKDYYNWSRIQKTTFNFYETVSEI